MTPRQKSPRRSLLFSPGDSSRKMEKGARLGADAIILDLEDAVAYEQKEAARSLVVSALNGLDFGRTERLVRVNAQGTEQFAADVAEVAKALPDGLVIPKVETAAHLQAVEEPLSAAEAENGRPAHAIRLFALIETARGVMNIREIAQSSPRLDGLLFGAEDLAVDLGAARTPAGWEIFYARSAVVTAAAAYGLQAIDMVFVDLNDLAALEREADFGRQLGYTGKMAIHPGQVPVINRLFTPSEAEVEHAQRLVQAYQAQSAAGSGAFRLDGRMVDKPIVQIAENLLRRAELCRLFDKERKS